MYTTEVNRQGLFPCIHVQSFGSQLLDVQQSELTFGLLCLTATSILVKYLLQTASKQLLFFHSVGERWEILWIMKLKKRCGEIFQNLSIVLKHVCHRSQHLWFFTHFINFICTNCGTHVSVKVLQELLSPGVKILGDWLGLGEGRWVRTWNCRAPIEISAHSSSSKDSGALMTMLARKRRINSSISKGSSNLSHRVGREKEKHKVY